MKKEVVFINGWPNSVRPMDTFIPEIKDRTILVCSKGISDEYLQNGWSCIPVAEHSWESYREHVLPRLVEQNIKCVVADSEMHIEPAAHLREALGIPGQTVASAKSFRNKLTMLGFLRGASTFRVPRYLKIGTATRQEAETFCVDLMNVVVKPIDGTDSKSVRLISSEDFLREYEHLPHDHFAQEWIDAPIFHVDGLVVRGDLKFFSVAKYFNSCLQYSQGGVVGSEMVRNESIIGQFGRAIRETLVLMPTPFNTTFHAEFFLDEVSNCIIFCEIASRTGGACGTVAAALEFEFGINLPREMIAANVDCTYQPKSYVRRLDGNTAATLLIPADAMRKPLPKAIPDVIYLLPPSAAATETAEGHWATDDAVKLVFTAAFPEMDRQRRKLMSLLIK